MFEQATAEEPRNVLADWALRGGVGLAFILFGMDKFPSGPDAMWVKLFQQIGLGQWFRYFTGVVEVLGGVLVLIPWTTTWGLALLAGTMASAALIMAFVLGRPGDSIFSVAFCVGLSAFWLSRRR
jgi:uncharacterized membrane protein YphA (DoxX/SURF4 family)